MEKIFTNWLSSIETGIAPPKNKVDKKDDAILNKQDDNSYEEPPADNDTNKPGRDKEENSETKNFEYRDDGEFEDGSHLTDTNPNDDYL